MSRVIFHTGKDYQERAAVWVRQRLAESRGRHFSSHDDQDGVLLADSVGMGKTWEALAAAALVLYKMGPKSGRRHVLILCPANLVTKWEDELAANSPFRLKLERWAGRLEKSGQSAPARRVMETLKHVLPIRTANHVQTRRKRGGFHPPGGTYIISQSLITGQRRRLNALRREEWDIVIVDEAHSAIARKALSSLQGKRRARTKILLTATPFQLEPRQWNLLARNLLKRSSKVLNQKDIERYINRLAEVFESPDKPGPKRTEVKAASEVMRRLAVRSYPQRSNRRYGVLLPDGAVKPLPVRLDELDDKSARGLLGDLRRDGDAGRDFGFEKAYFEKRFKLATNENPTYVATVLRRFLATGTPERHSPRRVALRRWAEGAFASDILHALETGLPRKTVVFTAWVGDKDHGEARMLHQLLSNAFDTALGSVRKRFGVRWTAWAEKGRRRIDREAQLPRSWDIEKALQAPVDDLTAVLAGKHKKFVDRMRDTLHKRITAISEAEDELRDLRDGQEFEKRALRRRRRDARSALSLWTNARMIGPVGRYTGNERRTQRDRVATAFCEIGLPWVLVASNVGSEGIDLHRYTTRIVHYDLEWNPARMEQREGRGDRVGRQIKDKLEILYCIVPRTYDERMFYQLVARDRWHGVLLGKPASELKAETKDAPLIDRKRLNRMRLDLAPRV